MTRTSDGAHEPPCNGCTPGAGPPHGSSAPRRVLVVDADHTLLALLEEWLAGKACAVVEERSQGGGAGQRYDLVIVDVPFPREGGADLLRRIAHEHPATPVLALSSAFFDGVGCRGPVARALGVTCVVPKTASRETLTRVVGELLSA